MASIENRLARVESAVESQRPDDSADARNLSERELERLSGLRAWRRANPEHTENDAENELRRIAGRSAGQFDGN